MVLAAVVSCWDRCYGVSALLKLLVLAVQLGQFFRDSHFLLLELNGFELVLQGFPLFVTLVVEWPDWIDGLGEHWESCWRCSLRLCVRALSSKLALDFCARDSAVDIVEVCCTIGCVLCLHFHDLFVVLALVTVQPRFLLDPWRVRW